MGKYRYSIKVMNPYNYSVVIDFLFEAPLLNSRPFNNIPNLSLTRSKAQYFKFEKALSSLRNTRQMGKDQFKTNISIK